MKNITLLICLLLSFNVFAQTWTMQNVGFHIQGSDPFKISITSASNAWVFGDDQVGSGPDQEFSRTIDGGANWVRGLISQDTGFITGSIAAINDSVAYVATGSLTLACSKIYRTVDGGVNWLQAGAGQGFDSLYMDNIYFWNAAEGINICDPVGSVFQIFKTSDSGNTWTQVPGINIPAALSGEYNYPKTFEVHDSTIWFGTQKGRIFRSTDRGLNWDVHTVLSGVFEFTTVSFLGDKMTGISTVYDGPTSTFVYYRTADGGNTWNAFSPVGNLFFWVKSIPGTNYFVSVDGAPDNVGGGGSSYSVDNGYTWTTIDLTGSGTIHGYGWVAFLDINTGWASGTCQDSLTDGIYKWNSGILGISNLNDLLSETVFPNPFNSQTKINFERRLCNASFNLYDVLGQKVKSIEQINNTELIFQREDLSSGIYLYDVIENRKKVAAGKLVIQ